jgi:hypothetical protein
MERNVNESKIEPKDSASATGLERFFKLPRGAGRLTMPAPARSCAQQGGGTGRSVTIATTAVATTATATATTVAAAAATAAATAVATATATAVATATTAAAAATRTGRPLARLVDGQRPTVDLVTVQGRDRCLQTLIRIHLNETETA